MSDFLKQLGETIENRNDPSEIYQQAEAFREKLCGLVADTLLEELKKAILDSAKAGEFSYENGKKVVSGIYRMRLGDVKRRVLLSNVSGIGDEHARLFQQLYEMKLDTSKLGISDRPSFSDEGLITHQEQKKILFFERTITKKYKKVSFYLEKNLLTVIKILNEKAKANGIALSNLSYRYMYNSLNRETGETDSPWIRGCSITFPDLVSPVTYEWTWTPRKCVVDFGDSSLLYGEIKFSVEA